MTPKTEKYIKKLQDKNILIRPLEEYTISTVTILSDFLL